MVQPPPAPAAPSDSVVRAALDATFRQPAYARGVRETLLSRAWSWLSSQLDALRAKAASSPGLAWTLLAVVGALAVVVVARAIYLRRARAESRLVPGSARARTAHDDPWHAAAALAAAGDYTAAAHALYAALLARLAARERLTRHPSKTAGDYARDLRALGSRAYAPFRRFARDYDLVVYGLGTCDAPTYGRLLDAANGVLPLSRDGGRAGAA